MLLRRDRNQFQEISVTVRGNWAEVFAKLNGLRIFKRAISKFLDDVEDYRITRQVSQENDDVCDIALMNPPANHAEFIASRLVMNMLSEMPSDEEAECVLCAKVYFAIAETDQPYGIEVLYNPIEVDRDFVFR